MKKQFYTVKEYAKITGLHKNTVYEHIRDGYIETVQKGKNYKHLIPYYELPTFIRKEKHGDK